MLPNDYRGKAVLITGGTKGLGLATGLAFGRVGADVYLTHKWGSADESAIQDAFRAEQLPAPVILEADAGNEADTTEVMEAIRRQHDGIEAFVSNVSFAQVPKTVGDYRKRHFLKSIEYSAWPFVGYAKEAKKVFDRYPRYIVGTSCDGPDIYYPNYDFVAVSKTLMEVFCRYLGKHLFHDGVRVNIVRSRPVVTESFNATFGDDFAPFLQRNYGDRYFITADEVGKAILALCSGWFDAMTGQVILLDRGVAFSDNLMGMFERRAELGLE
jgi:enoyl-[acyl-carrier-protein] reductase (NADH)